MNLSINQQSTSVSLIERLTKEREEKAEELASGKKINHADDDVAGLQISNRLTAEINELQQLSFNAQDQTNIHQVESGQLASINDELQRANVLSIQSGNPLSDDTAIQGELDQIVEQINTVAGDVLGDSSFLSGLDASDPTTTQATIEEALTTISEASSSAGAETNALANQVSTYETSRVNVTESRSRIEDTDFAKTTTEEEQNNILLQSAIIQKKEEDSRKGLLVNTLV